MREWNRASLGMYIDDGAIFACGHDWKEIENAMRAGYCTRVWSGSRGRVSTQNLIKLN
jgi:hypothetical protein